MNAFVKNTVLTGILAAVTIPVQAAPAISLGEDASLFATLSAGAEYQSNILRQEVSENDLIFTVTPGVELQAGTENAAYLEATLGLNIRIHDTFDELDGEFIRFNSLGYYDTGVALFKGYASANEYGSNSISPSDEGAVAELAERSDLAIGGSFNYLLSDQFSISGGVDVFHRSFNDASLLAGFDSISVPVRVLYAFDPVVSAFGGYRYRTSTPFNAPLGSDIPDTEDHYVFVGIEGEIFNPLWTGSIDVGYQTRDFSNSALISGSTDTFSYNARLNYAADTNLNFFAVISRDFGSGITNSAVAFVRDRYSLGGDYLLTDMWSIRAEFTLADTQYEDTVSGPGREDQLTAFAISATWTPNEYLRVTGSFQLNDVSYNNVTSGPEEFQNNIISVRASLRY